MYHMESIMSLVKNVMKLEKMEEEDLERIAKVDLDEDPPEYDPDDWRDNEQDR
jgi:hypothetical protein